MQINCSRYLAILFLSMLFAIPVTSFSQDKKIIDSLTVQLRKAEKAGNDTLVVNELSRLVMAYQMNNPEQALKISKKQLSFSKKIDYNWDIASAYNAHGIIYTDIGDNDKALEYYKMALQEYSKIGQKIYMVDINNNIGTVYTHKGIYTEALKYSLKALAIAIQEKDSLGICSSYNNIGVIYEGQKQYAEALKYYQKSLKVMKRLGKGNYIQVILRNIGKMHLLQNQLERALVYYKEAIQESVAEYDDYTLANSYSGMGHVYVKTQEWEKAIENYTKAFEIRKRMEDMPGLTSSYLSLGDVYFKTGNLPKALEFANKAKNQIKDLSELELHLEVHNQLSKIYDEMGHYKLAHENHKLYKIYNDSVFNSDNAKKLTEQQMNFDFKLKEEKKEAEARQALKYQKNIRNYTIAGLLLIAVFTFVLFRQRYRLASVKKQKVHEVAMQKVESEMALKELALKAETENNRLKEEQMKERLQFNQRELASATLNLYQKNEILSGLRKEIDALPAAAGNAQFEKIRSAVQNEYYAEADWERFRIHFEQVHPDFFKDLNENYPTLTAYEIRLCAYLHLKMSTKEIAGLLNITPDSVIKAKMRLNKKLNPPDQSA